MSTTTELDPMSIITFPSKEEMMAKFKEDESLNYFIKKGIMQSIIDQVANQKRKIIGIDLLIELTFDDFTHVFESTPPMAINLYKMTLKNALIRSAN
jgi:hypothetical protein